MAAASTDGPPVPYYTPPGPASELASITSGFLLIDGEEMNVVKAVASTLVGYKIQTNWHSILNNATSTRPKSCGGPTITPLKGLLAFHRVGDLKARGWISTDEYPDASWCGTLKLPNSFEMGDGRVLEVAAVAQEKSNAHEAVCLLAFTHLLLRDPTSVLLRSNHWSVDVTRIQQDVATMSGGQPPGPASGSNLAPAPPPRSRKAMLFYEPPVPGGEQERDELICDILVQFIKHDFWSTEGLVYPTDIKHGGWKLLRQYVRPGALKTFISEHKQFQVHQMSRTTWAYGFAAESGAPGSASAAGSHAAAGASSFMQTIEAAESRAPGSASAAGSPGGNDVSPVDIAQLRMFLASGPGERDCVVHKCMHGEWLKRTARPLPAGHELARWDSEPYGSWWPECCRPCPREECYDEKLACWMVWDPETLEWCHEKDYYCWIGLE
jgi:hypothetical protein